MKKRKKNWVTLKIQMLTKHVFEHQFLSRDFSFINEIIMFLRRYIVQAYVKSRSAKIEAILTKYS